MSEKGFTDTYPLLGATIGRRIYLVPQNFLNTLSTLGHETGHYLATGLSFVNRQVLTPDEVKQTRVKLTPKEILTTLFTLFFLPEKTTGLAPWIYPIYSKLITAYAKGNFDPDELKIHFNYPIKKMVAIAKRHHSSTYTFDKKRKMQLISSKDGRNVELPACTVELAILYLFKNSLQIPHFLRVAISSSSSGEETINSHTRARKIVEAAYRHTGWILPSLLDMGYKED